MNVNIFTDSQFYRKLQNIFCWLTLKLLNRSGPNIRRTSKEHFFLENFVEFLQNPPMITTKQENGAKNCCFVVSTANSWMMGQRCSSKLIKKKQWSIKYIGWFSVLKTSGNKTARLYFSLLVSKKRAKIALRNKIVKCWCILIENKCVFNLYQLFFNNKLWIKTILKLSFFLKFDLSEIFHVYPPPPIDFCFCPWHGQGV